MADEIERIITVPLGDARNAARTQRADRAVKEVRSFIARHMQAHEEDVWIDSLVNESLWSRGRQKPPRRLRVRAIKFDDGVVEVSLPEE